LHLGVTEAGDGEDGRIKSAVGIGTLLEDGIGDTIRVSLTEDPEFEVPVCRDIIAKYAAPASEKIMVPSIKQLPYDPFSYQRRKSFAVQNIGGTQVPVVIADLSKEEKITPKTLESIGYHYDEPSDKWNIGDQAADFIFFFGNVVSTLGGLEANYICILECRQKCSIIRSYFYYIIY
jgi:(E)-4-hydroxy-3-methylbut-2-enyl-diphosphate synthase